MKVVKGFKIRSLCGEYIIVAEGASQVNFNKMISLNESAAYLWKAVEHRDSFTAEDLRDLLLEEYEVDEATAAADAAAIAEKWVEIGIAEK
jgi:hypothetical protein